jgi:hypothetical protein
MRPMFLDRNWRTKRVLRRTAGITAVVAVIVVGFYAALILVGLARMVSGVCP